MFGPTVTAPHLDSTPCRLLDFGGLRIGSGRLNAYPKPALLILAAWARSAREPREQSSRRLEREAGRNLEVLWLLGQLVPDDGNAC